MRVETRHHWYRREAAGCASEEIQRRRRAAKHFKLRGVGRREKFLLTRREEEAKIKAIYTGERTRGGGVSIMETAHELRTAKATRAVAEIPGIAPRKRNQLNIQRV